MSTSTSTPTIPAVEEMERWLEDDDDTRHLVCMPCDAGPVVVRTLCGLRMTVDHQAPPDGSPYCRDCLVNVPPHLACR